MAHARRGRSGVLDVGSRSATPAQSAHRQAARANRLVAPGWVLGVGCWVLGAAPPRRVRSPCLLVSLSPCLLVPRPLTPVPCPPTPGARCAARQRSRRIGSADPAAPLLAHAHNCRRSGQVPE